MNQLDLYKAKLSYMKMVSETGLGDIEKLEVGMRALRKYHDRAANMSEEYRANFVELFGQEALDKVDDTVKVVGTFLADIEAALNG
ncbi:hypothetical protein [Hydrogenimonas sp.]